MKFLIAGLGNIGPEYDMTRHNVGFDVVDVLAIKNSTSFRIDRLASVAEFKLRGKTFILIKPTTYMNLSGKAVKYWMDKEKVPIGNTLVIVDELALPLGTLRMKGNGSAGGHNGLKSIEETLKTNQYPRLRFGIGNDFPKGRQVDFVLGKWTEAEMATLKLKLPVCADMVESFGLRGLVQTMNDFNKK